MSYKFKGYSWSELAECWGITVEEKPFIVSVQGKKDKVELGKLPEKIDVRRRINNTDMVFTTEDEEEVLAEKVKRFMFDRLNISTGKFEDPQIRTDLNNFLQALYEESKEIDYNYPVYKAMIEIENDQVLVRWVADNLERLWT